MFTTLLVLIFSANGASLDLLEVGGNYGTPAATNGTASFWNPAGLAMEQGTRLNFEGAPAFANVKIDLDGYGEYWGGKDEYSYFGIAPFAGVATDFGIDNLGLGLSLSVPFAKGAEAIEPGGNGRYHLEKADIKSVFLTAAASYRIQQIAFGVSGSVISSSWSAVSNTETLTSLKTNLEDSGLTTDYAEDELYNPKYTTSLNFKGLADTTYTFSAGLYYSPSDNIGISASYIHGGSFTHTGDLDMSFDCPPEEDVLGSFGANLTGTCYGEFTGQSTVAYDFPWRTNLGIRWMPTGDANDAAIELMGAYVGWSDFTDYNIITDIDPDSVDLDDADARGETADTVSQNRLWARDNQSTFWVGIDAKKRVLDDKLLVGGRIIFDKSAIPDSAVAASNYDANTVILSGLVAVNLTPGLDLGLSYSHYLLAKRTTTTSAFATTLDSENAVGERYFYPSANGSYATTISRLGLSLTGHFDGAKKTATEDQ